MVAFGDFSDSDVTVELDNYIALVEFHRPPHNYFDVLLLKGIADAFHALDKESDCRAIVLASEGKSFCAGAQLGNYEKRDFSDTDSEKKSENNVAKKTIVGRDHVYEQGVRMMESGLPVIAAVQGAAIGGGLGVALSADFRVAAREARFSANFSRLGFHHGFGLTVTLPALVGDQMAANLLYTGRRVGGEEALQLGLCDDLVPMENLRSRAFEMAEEIAISAPLSVKAIRRTMRQGLVDRFRMATDHEQVEQDWLRQTNDFSEGVRAMSERRSPDFKGN
ncbi:MAG: enoyl-CoA hydratase/isomerase family protein [Tepidiformaceae bacterium]|tara:strand:+ start:3746 stop:4582 length:837 start_codon:yes stop_codon:yes gene_type:complete